MVGLACTACASSLNATKVASASAFGIWAYQAPLRSATPGVASNTALILSLGAAANILARAIVTSSWFFRGVTKLGPIASTAFLCADTASFTSFGSKLTLRSSTALTNSLDVGTSATYLSSTEVVAQSVAFTMG